MDTKNKSILEVEEKISMIMQDIRMRINSYYDSMGNNDIEKELPDFDMLVKNKKLLYMKTRNMIKATEEIINLKIHINIVYRYIIEIKGIKCTNQKEYIMLSNFKNNLKNYEDELFGYRQELSDVIKNNNSKIRLLESINFIIE